MFFLINRTEFDFQPFHDEIIKKLEDIYYRRNKKKNLMINIAVGSGKSAIIEWFITWAFANDIDPKFLYVSHSDRLITKLSGETLDIIESEYWQSMFNHPLKQKSSVEYSFEGGATRSGMSAAPMGSGITGIDAGNPAAKGKFKGALIIDDPNDADDADSDILLQQARDTYTNKLKTRLRTEDTPIIVIMQRLSTNDLAGYIEDVEYDDYDILRIPAYNENTKTSFWERKFPVEKLMKIKLQTPSLFWSQYQQDPQAAGGGQFTNQMFQVDALPEFFDFTAIVADTAYRNSERNDWTVFMAVGKSNGRLYILDIKRMRVNSNKVEGFFLPFIEQYSHRDDFIGCFIEPKGHGIYLNQHLPELGVPIQADTVIREFYKDRKKDKLIRANVVLPDIQNHKVTFNYQINQELVQDCIKECLEFPDGKHDDMVDCIVDSAKLVYKHIPSLLEVL